MMWFWILHFRQNFPFFFELGLHKMDCSPQYLDHMRVPEIRVSERRQIDIWTLQWINIFSFSKSLNWNDFIEILLICSPFSIIRDLNSFISVLSPHESSTKSYRIVSLILFLTIFLINNYDVINYVIPRYIYLGVAQHDSMIVLYSVRCNSDSFISIPK